MSFRIGELPRSTVSPSMSKAGILVASLIFLLLSCVVGAAQTSTRYVSGTVTDQYREPLRGAVVQIENSMLLGVRSYITQRDGRYHFSRLSFDVDYRLRAFYRGSEGPAKTLSEFDSSDAKIINLEVHARQGDQ
jgi:hypothetical protein